MNRAVIRISTDRMIEIASAMSSSTAGSGRMSSHHADGERDVAAPEHHADIAKAGQGELAGLAVCRYIRHLAR